MIRGNLSISRRFAFLEVVQIIPKLQCSRHLMLFVCYTQIKKTNRVRINEGISIDIVCTIAMSSDITSWAQQLNGCTISDVKSKNTSLATNPISCWVRDEVLHIMN